MSDATPDPPRLVFTCNVCNHEQDRITRCPACGGVEWSVREEGEP